MDDDRFIELLKEKNPKGLSEIYETYAAVLYLFILQVTNDENDTEELLVRSFLRVWNDPVSPSAIVDPLLYLLQKASITLLDQSNSKLETELKIKKYLVLILKQRPVLNAIIPGPSHNLPQEPEPVSITAA